MSPAFTRSSSPAGSTASTRLFRALTRPAASAVTSTMRTQLVVVTSSKLAP